MPGLCAGSGHLQHDDSERIVDFKHTKHSALFTPVFVCGMHSLTHTGTYARMHALGHWIEKVAYFSLAV